MRLVKYAMAGLVSILAIFMVFIMLQPSEIKLEKSVLINAPVTAVRLKVDSAKQWESWAIWSTTQPENNYGYAGNLVRWEGITNEDINGVMDLTEVTTLGPTGWMQFETQDTAQIAVTVESAGDVTQVIWFYSQPISHNPLEKIKSMLSEKVIEQIMTMSLDTLKVRCEQ